MSDVALGLYLAGCLLLVGSGIAKLRRSRSALDAVRRVWPGAPAPVAPALGLAELSVGLAGMVVGGAAAWLVAGLYVALAGFAAVAVSTGAPVPCGCFGERQARISGVHLTLNVGFGAAALAVAASQSASLPLPTGDGFSSVLLWTLSALCAWLAFVAMTALVDVADAMNQESV